MFMSGYDRKNVFKNIVLYLCVSALFILPISTLLTSLPAFATGHFDSLDTQGKYKFYVYARVLNACFTRSDKSANEFNSLEEIEKGNIWNGSPSAYVGTFPGFTGYNGSGGYFQCNSELINTAISQFNIQPRGRASAIEVLLCEVGYKRGTKNNVDSCINSREGPFYRSMNDNGDQLDTYSDNKIFEVLARLSGYKNGIENSDPSIKYLVSRSMIKGCVKDNNPQPQRHDSKDWEIPDVDDNGNLTNSYYLPGYGQGYNVGGSNNREWPQDHYDAKIPEWQCMNIHKRLVESAPKYQEALKQSATDTACAGLAGEELAACKAGIEHKNEGAAYCKTYTDEKEREACEKGQNAKIETAAEEEEGGEPKNSCGIDGGLGWLICPVMTFVANINDAAYGAISGFLDIKPAILGDNSNTSGAKQGWNFFRNIANAIFAVIFLWIIFSQISNVGVSNYGIKKILPRLIIGALLVNLSYYLCQIFVDLSNILGHTLKDALEAGARGIGTESEAAGWGSAIAATIVGVGGVAAFAALAIGIPTLVAGFLAIMTVFIILVVRQAGIILLISMSPIAFAAWLLPNTEDLFKKWMKMFRGLLLVFPIISLLYGAGKLAGAVLAASATVDPNNPDETLHLVALAAATMPLLATPFVLQNSLSSLGSIGAKIGKMSANAHGRFAGNVKGTAKRRTDNSVIGDTKRKYADFMDRRRAKKRASGWRAKRDNNSFGQFMGWDKGGARARAAVDKAFESDVENASTILQGMTSSEIAAIAITGKTSDGKEVSRSMHAATIDHTMANGGFEQRMNVLSNLKGTDTSIKQRAIKASFAKGDNNIIGNKFGDAILEDKVGNMTDLENLAIDNAADGNLQAEHLVQNAAGTDWLVEATINAGSKKTNANYKAAKAAESNIKSSAIKARFNPNTAKNINGKLDDTFRKVGA